jgi:RNA polymerase sigma factor (sigma-70 family)
MFIGMPDHDSTSWTLVLGAAARRPEEQERFVERYAPLIKAYLAARWRLPVHHEDVADAAQEVLLQCIRPRGALESVDPAYPSGFRAFLYGVTRNVAAMAERTRVRHRETQADSTGVFRDIADEASLSGVFDRGWAELVVREARALLERRARLTGGRAALRAKALELRYQESLPPRDIAPRLGLDVKQVYKLLELGQLDFQEALLDVMALHVPAAGKAELERRCAELFTLLEG